MKIGLSFFLSKKKSGSAYLSTRGGGYHVKRAKLQTRISSASSCHHLNSPIARGLSILPLPGGALHFSLLSPGGPCAERDRTLCLSSKEVSGKNPVATHPRTSLLTRF